MNKKTFIIHIGIACLLVILTCLSYFNTRKQMSEVAERTFVEAVHQDLDERWKKSGATIEYFSIERKSKYVNLKIVKDDSSDKSYNLEKVDTTLNVDGDFYRRMFQTAMLALNKRINPNRLNEIWQNELRNERMDVETYIRVNYKDSGLPEMSDSLQSLISFTPLPLCYAGSANEIELNSFIKFTIWDVLSDEIYSILFLLLLVVWIVYVLSIVFVPNPLMKEGHILSKGIVYDPKSGCFYKRQKQFKLYPKSNAILKALLEAEDNQLHGVDLLVAAWGDNETDLDKLYTQNSLIRKVLKELGSGFSLDSVEGGYFKFVYPNASKREMR